MTLLEVMVAMAILSIALVAVYKAQTQSMQLSSKAEYVTTAMNLAKARLGEIEFQILEKGFEYLEEKDSGTFEDRSFSDYRWEYTAGKIEIPLVSVDDDSEQVSENSYLKMAKDMLEKSIKEVRLRVYYKEGRNEDFVEVVTHFSNPKDLPIVQSTTAKGGT